jgi:NADH-quinone oxidoreductase subunit J
VPVGLIMGLILYFAMKDALPVVPAEALEVEVFATYTKISSFTNIELLGLRLFEDLGLFLIIAGYILLLAMVGAIVLTLGHEGEIKRQDIFEQVSRAN